MAPLEKEWGVTGSPNDFGKLRCLPPAQKENHGKGSVRIKRWGQSKGMKGISDVKKGRAADLPWAINVEGNAKAQKGVRRRKRENLGSMIKDRDI